MHNKRSFREPQKFFDWLRKYDRRGKIIELARDRIQQGWLDRINCSLKPLRRVNKIVIHGSGFAAGNAELFRLYHKLVNGWCDIGYHFVIGNGKGDYSYDGEIQVGRSLEFQGAHVKGHNDDSLGICLIMSKGQKPTELQLLALENLVSYLLYRYKLNESSVTTHDRLAPKWDPGPGFNLEAFRERLKEKFRKSLSHHKVTINLRKLIMNPSNFDNLLSLLKSAGVTRVVFPLHWDVEKNLKNTCKMVSIAQNQGLETVLYTGPFGTEKLDLFKKYPYMRDWQMKNKDGKPITYDGLPFFCPNSPYLEEYRGPIIMEILNTCTFDWVFFDLPWFLRGGCYCKYCRSKGDPGEVTFKQRSLRYALSNFVLKLKNKFPHVKLAANIGCGHVIKSLSWTSATPEVFSGLFEEMVTEFTPRRGKEYIVSDCLKAVREKVGGVFISHAFKPETNGVVDPLKMKKISQITQQYDAGLWITPRFADSEVIKVYFLIL